MPYSLVFQYDDGRIDELKPLCCPNPKSTYGLEDMKIKKISDTLAKHLTKRFDNLKCYTKHYEE